MNIPRALLAGAVLLASFAIATAPQAATARTAISFVQVDLFGPDGSSDRFGHDVTVLTNGNYVVTDPGYTFETIENAGAAHIYNGTDDILIATLHGSAANDQVGSGGIVELTNGDYVVLSPDWNNGNVGAVTWVDGTTGITGPVTTDNSLHGTNAGDRIGSNIDGIFDTVGVATLANGAYVVISPDWDNGAVTNAGAVTWADSDGTTTGPVTTTNSLHGTQTNDQIGRHSVVALANANYVVISPDWDNGATRETGAVTWADGNGTTTGPVTTTNSLHGAQSGDRVGWSSGSVRDFAVVELSDGDYTVASRLWSNGTIGSAGAVTWADGSSGITGPVTTTNSLYGTTGESYVGGGGVTALDDGAYAVASPSWDDGAIPNLGAVTSTDGTAGPVTTANSLHGTTSGDRIGSGGVTLLTGGAYVVGSPDWDNAMVVDAGAATLVTDAASTTGPVATSNSRYGVHEQAFVGGGGAVLLTDGNFVVVSPDWTDGSEGEFSGPAISLGSVSFADRSEDQSGPVTRANSLYGTEFESIGSGGVTALPGGGYVVSSPFWENGNSSVPEEESNAEAGEAGEPPRAISPRLTGAATVRNGTPGVNGLATPANSLFGTTRGDFSDVEVVPFADGYLVATPGWDNGAIADVGAVTFSDSTAGVTGPIRPSISAIGTAAAPLGLPGNRLTSNNALPIPSVGRVVLVQFDRSPEPQPAVTPLEPARLVDTREGGITVDGRDQAAGKQGINAEREIQISGRGGVPIGAKAAVMNITAIAPEGIGFVTVHPCSEPFPRPLASSLNHTVGVNIGNEIIAPLNDAGGVCVYTSSETHITIDVVGYIDARSPLAPSTPLRYLDTRNDRNSPGRAAAGSTTRLQIAGRSNIAPGSNSATVNITAVNADEPGYLTVHPCLDTRPNAASVNYIANTNRANELNVTLDDNGDICIYTSADVHLLADVAGHLYNDPGLEPVDPARLLDTRTDGETIDGDNQREGIRGADTEYELQVTGRADVPAGATAAVIYITAVQPDGTGYVTAHPCTDQRPLASSLNHVDRVNGGNEIIAPLSDTGTICLYTSNRTHLTADVVGYTIE